MFIVQGARPGSGVFVPHVGVCVNGQLSESQAQYLRAAGLPVVAHTWIPPITDGDWFERASDQEKHERFEADLLLGRMPNAEGTTRIERDIAAAMAKATAPMRKSTLFAKMKKAIRQTW